MNFISPEILMENAIKKHHFKKPDDIYPPTENDFDNSIHKFVSDKRNINNQRINEILQNNESKNVINNYEQLPNNNKIENENENEIKRNKPETFYIPKQFPKQFNNNLTNPIKKAVEYFDSVQPYIEQPINSLTNKNVLIIIIIVMLLIIIYLYCKVESLQTINKVYELQFNKNKT